MQSFQAPDKNTNPAPESNGPRLVLITAEGPGEGTSPSPNEIIGSEPHIVGSGGFCLTDR